MKTFQRVFSNKFHRTHFSQSRPHFRDSLVRENSLPQRFVRDPSPSPIPESSTIRFSEVDREDVVRDYSIPEEVANAPSSERIPHPRLEIRYRKGAKSAVYRPPLLFVHGAYHAAWSWDKKFMPYFAARGFDVYAVSLSGHGESQPPEEESSMSLHRAVEDVREAVSLIPNTPVLVAHSVGCVVTQIYLETYGHDSPLPAMIFLAPIVPFLSAITVPTRIVRRLAGGEKWNVIQKFWSTPRLFATPEVYKKLMFCDAMSIDEVKEYHELLESAESPKLLLQFFAGADISKYGTEPSAPLLIVYGAEDSLIPVGSVSASLPMVWVAVRAPWRQPDCVVVPMCGHNIMLDIGWREAADNMMDWLDHLRSSEDVHKVARPWATY